MFSRVLGKVAVQAVGMGLALLLASELWQVHAQQASEHQQRRRVSPAAASSPAPRVGTIPFVEPFWNMPASQPAVAGYVPAHKRRSAQPAAYQESDSKATARPAPKNTPELIFSEDEVWVDDDSPGNMPTPLSHGVGDCVPLADMGCWNVCGGLPWHHLEIFGGAHGFTGPVNRGQTGSFGFHEGVNWGAPLPWFGCGMLGMQAGMRATHSHFSGASFTPEERQQIFVTGGIFRRVDWGFQSGIVIDYLHEDWYLETDLVQLRGEVSWLYPCHHEIGFWFTASTQKDVVTSRFFVGGQQTQQQETLQGTDLYAFFYRYRVDNCGGATGRVFAGFTGAADGLIGADFQVPINDAWALVSNFTYLVPDESNSSLGHVEEAWNFGLALVWRPGGGFLSTNYYRPLLPVADNGSFMVDRR